MGHPNHHLSSAHSHHAAASYLPRFFKTDSRRTRPSRKLSSDKPSQRGHKRKPSTPSSSSDGTLEVVPPSSCNLRRLFLSLLLLCVCWVALLGVLVQQSSWTNGDTDGATPRGVLAVFRSKSSHLMDKLHRFSSLLKDSLADKVRLSAWNQMDPNDELLASLKEYKCVGWRQTSECSPFGQREVENDQNCSVAIPHGVSGYCEIRHRHTNETRRVLQMHCNSLRLRVEFSCDMFQALLSYERLSTEYIHDPTFSFEQNQQQFFDDNSLVDTPAPIDDNGVRGNLSVGTLEEFSFVRGISMVIYDRLLPSVYASVRNLRAMGCSLPVELWYIKEETDVSHPLILTLVKDFGCFVRQIQDPEASGFFTKLYAVFYSAFDQVLFLDADNFVVRDPTYLFDLDEFTSTGALFWPDFWNPSNTIFNIHETSFVWTLFGLKYRDEFEQESGQLLIDRRRHQAALNTLMFYGFFQPRIPQEMRLVWGDKDLFRFAWYKTDSSFFFIQRPPGSAGTKHPDHKLFCGVTMVQHDPSGEIVFLHRNTEKLLPENNRIVWTHIQQFKPTSKYEDYRVRGANGGKVFPQFKRCFGKDVHYSKLFTLKSMKALGFAGLEEKLLQYAGETKAMMQGSGEGV